MGPIDRRRFIRSAGAAFFASLGPRAAEALDRTDIVFGTAFTTGDGGYGAALLDGNGRPLSKIRLPARGHEVVFSTDEQAVVFARRPGTFAVAFSRTGAGEPLAFSSPADRHFYGHGAFSADGKLLYATENDFEQARGIIGIYDATDRFHRVGEFSTFGTGPHDLHVMGDVLAVANGGLETHPDFGRTKLNIATMQPSLVFVDRRDGTLMARHSLASDLSKVSIRHMVEDRGGRLYIAGQHEGNPARIIPLLARWHPDTGLEPLPIADDAMARMKGYVGSIAINGDQLAVSSPKSGVMLRIDIGDPSRVEVTRQTKICGLAPMGADFAATSMVGTMQLANDEARETDLLWDNHLTVV